LLEGVLHGYQNKRIGKAEVRSRMIEGGGEYKIWRGERSSSKSGVEPFECSLITRDSVEYVVNRYLYSIHNK